MRPKLPLLCLCALAAAEDAPPAPGVVPADIVVVEDLAAPPAEGGPQDALAAFLAAHAHHRAGRTREALAGYVRFLGMPGRRELPARYEATVRSRIARMRGPLKKRYAAATALYAKDRAGGRAALKALAEAAPLLPEGRAARVIWHSDALKLAVDAARARHAAGDVESARDALAAAVRTFDASLYRYEAKSVLLDLGGPDLFEAGERITGGDAPTEDPAEPAPEEDEDGGLEIGED